jgi:hypothetical protein
MEKEIWKDIPEYEGLYQVSNLGNVKSLPKKWEMAYGAINQHNGKILKPWLVGRGYCVVSLHKNKICKKKYIHQLVAITFLNHKPNGYELVVDHINNNKSDNRAENLQIVTTRYNVSKAKNGSSKYTGVHFDKKRKKWICGIQYNSKKITLKECDDENEANLIYQKALFEIENNTFNRDNYRATFKRKYKGVYSYKTKNKTVIYSKLKINKKVIFLGNFKTEEDAQLAYQEALNKYNLV